MYVCITELISYTSCSAGFQMFYFYEDYVFQNYAKCNYNVCQQNVKVLIQYCNLKLSNLSIKLVRIFSPITAVLESARL